MNVQMPRHFSRHSFTGTATHDSHFPVLFNCSVEKPFAPHGKRIPFVSLQGYICLRTKKLPVNVPILPASSFWSFVPPPCIQKLPVPHTRVPPSLLYTHPAFQAELDRFVQSLHLLLPMLENIFDLMCQVPPVTSFQSFLRPHSEHFFHSVTSGTAHKSKCFISLRSLCLRTDLATLHSAFTLVFACPDK